jgi:hypothetical protein
VLSISLVPSKIAGSPSAKVRRADGRELFLHSRYDPLEEAALLVSGIEPKERTLYVVFGFGLGYHVKALLAHIPRSAHVLVVEPDEANISARVAPDPTLRLSRWTRDARLHFFSHHDPQVTPTHLVDRMVAWRLLAITTVPHVPSMMTAESFYRALAQEIPRALPAIMQRHLQTVDRALENDLRNFWANLPASWRAAPVARFRSMWRGQPVVIVSGGPSLTRALPVLERLRDRMLLLATASTVTILRDAGLRPDLVISVDPYAPNLAHFGGWTTEGVPLVYYHRIFRDIPQAYGGPLVRFVMQDEPVLPLMPARDRAPFRRGGTVAFSALQLAHHLGANPIVFVGQDFAFGDGRTHADGALYNRTFDRLQVPEDWLEVPGTSGQPVTTSRIFQAYLLHMQEYLLKFSRERPDVRHVNTASNGALIQGTEHVELAQALADCPPLSRPAREVIARALGVHAPVERSLQASTVSRWLADLDRLMATPSSPRFEDIFDAFRSSSLYPHAARSYDDLLYFHEAGAGRQLEAAAPGTLAARFRDHLQQVAGDLRSRMATP